MYNFTLNIKNGKSLFDIETEYVKLIIEKLGISWINHNIITNLYPLLLLKSKEFSLVLHNQYNMYSDIVDLFNVPRYVSLQPHISNFFSKNFDFKICPYCGIDYINSYRDHLDFYDDFSDFILNAPEGDLLRLKGVGKNTVKKIIDGRKSNIKGIKKELLGNKMSFDKIENSYDSYAINPDVYNHFTLDHAYPKNKFPFFQISLYNLIPSCYSCNCKLKGDIILPANLIPNSPRFDLGDKLEFQLIFDECGNKELSCNYKVLSDDELKFLKEFKILGRYKEHLKTVLEIETKATKYTKVNIEQIAKLVCITKDEVRGHIFGEDLINNNKDSFLFKLKSDILKIYNVK